MAEDRMTFSIAEDGTIKIETDSMEGPNHRNADELVGAVAKLAGGKTAVRHRPGHRHEHTHDHAHVHNKK